MRGGGTILAALVGCCIGITACGTPGTGTAPPAGVLRGRLLDALDLRPVAGARIRVEESDCAAVEGRVLDGEEAAPAPREEASGARVDPAPGVPAEPAFTGRVVDEDGRPVEGASVGGTRTDAEGRFAVESLRGNGGLAWVHRDGYLLGWIRVPPPRGKGMEIVLERGTTLRGSVVLPDGTTAARNFDVLVFDDEGEDGALRDRTHTVPPGSMQIWPGDLPASRTFSGPDGRFAFPAVPEGVVAVVVRSGDLASPLVRGIRIRKGEEPGDLHLRLGTGPVLAVEVVDGEGRPVPKPEVILGASSGADGAEDPALAELGSLEGDASGRAEFRGLLPDPYVVGVGNGRGTSLVWKRVVVAPGGITRVVLALPGTGTLRLEAVDGEGRAVEGASVQFIDDAGEWTRILRVVDGEWDEVEALESADAGPGHEWSGIAAGDHRARISAEGYEDAMVAFAIRRGETTAVRAVLRRR